MSKHNVTKHREREHMSARQRQGRCDLVSRDQTTERRVTWRNMKSRPSPYQVYRRIGLDLWRRLQFLNIFFWADSLSYNKDYNQCLTCMHARVRVYVRLLLCPSVRTARCSHDTSAPAAAVVVGAKYSRHHPSIWPRTRYWHRLTSLTFDCCNVRHTRRVHYLSVGAVKTLGQSALWGVRQAPEVCVGRRWL